MAAATAGPVPSTALLNHSMTPSPTLRHRSSLPNLNDAISRDAPSSSREDAESPINNQLPTPQATSGALNGAAENGLPPTPPSLSQEDQSVRDPELSPHAASAVASLMSKKSSLSTPVNARSPPTPDPSPPRTHNITSLDRPPMLTYPSSRADSFQTAREEPVSSDLSDCESITPIFEARLSTVDEDRGLGLAFERDDSDMTPTAIATVAEPEPDLGTQDTQAGAEEDKETPVVEDILDREKDIEAIDETDLTDRMRNVTIRKRRTPQSSPRKRRETAAITVETASPIASPPKARRTSSLRERVEASTNTPRTPSIENFAQSIGWPTDEASMKQPDAGNKRLSTSSVTSTIVEATILVTPPRRRQTLRHSGKNMAFRKGSGSPEVVSRTPSYRDSLQSDGVPLHRLVHKRASIKDRSNRISAESDTLSTERYFSSPVSSVRQRTLDSSAHTLRHQESVRMVLQPAADILSRSNSLARAWTPGSTFSQRISSAPESGRLRRRDISPLSPPTSSQSNSRSFNSPEISRVPPVKISPRPSDALPSSRRTRPHDQQSPTSKQKMDINKSLPELPLDVVDKTNHEDDIFVDAPAPLEDPEEKRPPSALMERVRQLVAEREAEEAATPNMAASAETPLINDQDKNMSPPLDSSPPIRRGSRSSRGRSGERRGSLRSQDRSSLSPDTYLRPGMDRQSNDEMNRRSYEWRRHSEEHGRASFDRSTIRTDEHAMARHLFSQTTPFSQFSDTPIELSEATTVSIFPHNNHSLLVVQQGSTRGNSMFPDSPPQQVADVFLTPRVSVDRANTPTPPFQDAIEGPRTSSDKSTQPTVTFEPSTPPMQISLPQPNAVDSPLKNPRPPPEPPMINFIPPTPAEELERTLVPGPPKRSDSHPQRRLSLVQRARRYSDNLIPTLLARAGSNRGRRISGSKRHTHRDPRVPTVNDGDGALHPFWRPRGFWDDFTDSESESDEEPLPTGGDTSDIQDPPPAPPKRSNSIGKRLTSGLKGSGGFLIGNSLGVERHGTNRRRPQVTLPSHRGRITKKTSAPKILIQPPTVPLGHIPGGGITKRSSRSSLRDFEGPQRRASWRDGKSLPGLKKYQVQYIGISGVKERLKERTAEKRREKLRQSIGPRYYVENGNQVSA